MNIFVVFCFFYCSIQDELIERFRLSDERLDEPCMDGHLTAIALYLTTWKTVAPHLGLNRGEIEAIESDAQSTQEMRQTTLQRWADKFAHRATFRSLITVFLKIDNAELATKVCHLLVPGPCKFITHYLVQCL